jgi:hypothetical protein
MNAAATHLRKNVVAYIALFVALGGTSYAAVSLPAGSVGTRQLKDHSITPSKFDTGSIAGYVRDWAMVDPSGQLVASRPHAHLVGWGETGEFPGGIVSWSRAIPRSCVAIASTDALPPLASAGASIISGSKAEPFVGAEVLLSAPTEVTVAVICPQP